MSMSMLLTQQLLLLLPEEFGLNFDYPAMVIFDNSKGQLTERVMQVLEENIIQPMDISVNKVIKLFICNRFICLSQEWSI